MAAAGARASRSSSRSSSRSKGWRQREASKRGQQHEPFSPSTASERRAGRRHAREQSKPLRDAYQQGRADSRKPRRRRTPAPAKKAARQITQPVTAQVSSGLRVLGLAFAVVFLYDVLQAPGVTAGFLQAPAKALAWLSSPTSGVPKKG